MEGLAESKLEGKKSETKNFSADFIGYRVKTLLSSKKGIKEVRDLSTLGTGHQITISATMLVEKGPTATAVGVTAVLENRGGKIFIASYNIDASEAIKEKVEKMIAPKLNEIPEMLKSNIEKGGNGKVEKMEIVNGALLVTYSSKEEVKKTGQEEIKDSFETKTDIDAEMQKEFDKLWHEYEPTLPTPSTLEEKEIEKEIEKIPEKEKENMAIGLGTIGFVVEKKKNDFFASVYNRLLEEVDKKGTAGRFFKGLRNTFVRDAKNAEKNAENVTNGSEKNKLLNAGTLFGNVVRYGRLITDLSGASLASPLRYAMMGGMAFTRASEAGKEARLMNEEVMEKTRIEDADQAAEEAWAIYNKAAVIEEDGSKKVSAETLENAYLMNIPEDLLNRLEDPSTANSFLQKILRKDLESGVDHINIKIRDIYENDKLSESEKKRAERKVIEKYRTRLTDYDRILTRYGTVDELAMAGRYAQTVGKAVVAVVTAETLILSAEKMWGALSNVLSSHDIHPVAATGKFVKQMFAGNEKAKIPSQNIGAHDIGLPNEQPAPQFHPDTILANAIVHKGQGIEHAFIRQIENNPKLAADLGFKGNINDKMALHAFAQHEAHVTAIKTGYVDKVTGGEIRVAEANKVAYEIKMENGHRVVTEKTLGGKILETHREGENFQKVAGRSKYKYPKNR